jgi:hypothetical protein
MGSALLALLAAVAIGLVPAAAADVGVAPHAYYLFLAGAPQGCEDCYVPLLITQKPLGDVASSGRNSAVVLITTYERDSIWKLERDVPLAAADISAPERVVRLPPARETGGLYSDTPDHTGTRQEVARGSHRSLSRAELIQSA